MDIYLDGRSRCGERVGLVPLLLLCVASSGIFFIRNDWPFGVDGSYITLSSIGVLVVFVAAMIARSGRLFSPTPILMVSAFWVISVFSGLLIASFLHYDLDIVLYLSLDFFLVFAIFFIPYFFVRRLKLDPLFILFLGFPWLILASYAVLDAAMISESVRRVKVLSSVNYSGASFAAFFVLSVFFIVNKTSLNLLWRLLLFFVLFASLPGIFFSASRSAYAAIVVVIFVLFLFLTVNSSLAKEKKIGKMRTILFSLFFLFFGVLIFFFFSFYNADLNELLDRFKPADVKNALAERVELWRGAFPAELYWFVAGRAELYELWSSDADTLHPHNIFISYFRYLGLFSGLAFLGLCGVLILMSSRQVVRLNGMPCARTAFCLLSVFIIFLVYASVSGNFTRVWHLYWVMGLLAGYLDSGGYGYSSMLAERQSRFIDVGQHT